MTQADRRPAVMTLAELLALPMSFDVVTAGRAHGISQSTSYRLARKGRFPCAVRRVGRSYRVNRTDLLRSLGVDPREAGGGNSDVA